MNNINNWTPSENKIFNLKNTINWNEFFENRLVYVGMELPEQRSVIEDCQGTPIGSLGEVILLTGKPKSGKSRILSAFLAAPLAKTQVCGIAGNFYDKKDKVVIFDTEQNAYYNYLAFERIRIMAGLNGDDNRLRYYSIAGDLPQLRFDAIEAYLERNEDTLLLLIDGVADLCFDINNVNEAAQISTKLNALAEKYQVLIICVIHQNKGDENAKGHLGSYLTQKCCCHLSVERPDIESDERNVVFKMSRGKLPRDFSFIVGNNGLPELTEFSRKTVKGPFTSYSLDLDVHKSIIVKIFEDKNDGLTAGELKGAIKTYLEKLDKPSGDNAVRSFLSRWKTENWIKDNGLSTNKLRYYHEKPF